MITYAITVFAIVSIVMIPIRIAKMRDLARKQRELEASAMARGSIPPPLPK